MKISVELSDSELKQIQRVTHEPRKGPAIRKLVVTALMLEKRREGCAQVVSGEWTIDLPPISEIRRERRL